MVQQGAAGRGEVGLTVLLQRRALRAVMALRLALLQLQLQLQVLLDTALALVLSLAWVLAYHPVSVLALGLQGYLVRRG